MKKSIKTVDEKRGIVQVTTFDERWYVRQVNDKVTGLPKIEFVPSVTWICEHYPKGLGFYKWLANKGWDEAEAIRESAGDKGTKVHAAVNDLIKGKEVHIDDKYLNPSTNELEELTNEEYACVISFVEWYKDVHPVFLNAEFVVYGDGYAGTVDLSCTIGMNRYIVDFKTSQNIWPSHELQLSAYKHAVGDEEVNLAILQLGYQRNQKYYKFTEVEDQYELFLVAKQIWAKETKGITPLERDYPLSVKLMPNTEIKEKTNAKPRETKQVSKI